MGLFDSKNIFSGKQKIKDALFQIESLDYRQRPVVYETLIKELADGGVSAVELKKVVHELREKGEISGEDQINLLNLIK